MKWYTHAAVGANAAWFAVAAGQVDGSIGLLIGAGAFAALLPDIETPGAKIHFLFGGALSMFRGHHQGLFQHRGITHSLFASLIVFFLSFFLWNIHPLLPFAFGIGYVSHPIIDAFNTSVGYLFPFYNKRFNIIPSFMRSKVGGPADQLFFVLGTLGVLFLLISHLDSFVPATAL